jgi:prevent-host-death family protein
MKITTKELRIQPGKIIEQVANGEEVTVTFRGRALAKIIPIRKRSKTDEKEDISIFGLWKEHEEIKNVEDYVRELRKGRQF